MTIKLVASDIDGTLLAPGQTELSPCLFSHIEALHARGIRFCAASGRQYESLRKLFAPVANQILFLCENGAIVYAEDKVLAKTPLSHADCEQLCAQILAQPGCEVLLSAANTSYLIPRSEAYVRHVRDELGNNTVCVSRLEDVKEDILKVSIFTDAPAEQYAPKFLPIWEGRLSAAVAGMHWMDFTLDNKVTGLAQVSEALNIAPRDMLVFGDNFNDIPMFRFAGRSYAMESAAAQVRAAAHHTCTSVEAVLETLV